MRGAESSSQAGRSTSYLMRLSVDEEDEEAVGEFGRSRRAPG